MIITIDGNIPSKYAHSFNVMKMAQGFYEIGQQVELVTLMSLPNMLTNFMLGNIYEFYGVSNKIKITRIPVYNLDFLKKTISAKGYNERAAKYIQKIQPNFVHARSYLTVYYCVKLGIPTIMETHTTAYDLPDLKKIYEIAQSKYFLGLVTTLENIKTEHIQRGIPPEKVIAIPNGVDLKLFELSESKLFWKQKLCLDPAKRIIAYCGSLYKEKGIESILLTAKRLTMRQDLLFVIIGGTIQQIKEWQIYCQQQSIRNVYFTGFVNNNLTTHYMKAADIMIMPFSKKITYNIMDGKDSIPIKLFEYMASKRPIISSDAPIVTSILKHNHNAMLAKPDDIMGLAEYIITLLDNELLANQIANNAFADVQKYQWSKRCQKVIEKFVLPYGLEKT